MELYLQKQVASWIWRADLILLTHVSEERNMSSQPKREMKSTLKEV